MDISHWPVCPHCGQHTYTDAVPMGNGRVHYMGLDTVKDNPQQWHANAECVAFDFS